MTVFPSFRDLFRISILLPCLMTGCDGEVDHTDHIGDTITHTLENSGYACLLDDGNDDTSTGTIQVVLADCLSGCANGLVASCEATVLDQNIDVTASGQYAVPSGEADCPAGCIELIATCDISGISEDTWTMTYAGESTEIDFPASDQTCTDAAG